MLLAGTIFIYFTQEMALIFPFYAIFGNFLLGVFVLFNDCKNQINISYASTTFLTVLWVVFVFLSGAAGSSPEALLWGRLALVAFSFLPIPFIYFFSVFPKEDVIPKKYQVIAWFCIAIFFSVISFSDLLVKEVAGSNGNFVVIPGSAFVLLAIYFVGFLFFAFSRLIESYKHYRGLNRRQISYVLVGFFLGFIFPVFANLILPLFGYSGLTRVGPISTIITVGFISYAITKSHLLDISVIISRAVAEILAIIFYAGIYLGLVGFYRNQISIRIDIPFLSWTIVYGILVGQTHQRLRLFIQTTADKLFLHGKYDYYKALSDASSHVGEKLSLQNALKVLYDTFHDVVEISNPRIYLPENFTDIEKSSDRYVVYSQKDYSPKGGDELRFDAPLIQELAAKREPLPNIKELHAALVVPCLLEERLIAFFALGPKLSQDQYTDEDLRLLKVLANQVAITLDHTRSYEKIKIDLEAAERQLERSQRLAAIGTLTAGVTHEIRNPLTVIRAEAERIANQPRDIEYLKQFRDLVLIHIDRISGIVQRMLSLAKDKPKEITEINLNDLIDTTLNFFTFSKVTVQKEFSPLHKIKGDAAELQEVFVNLIQNSWEAMPNGGTLTVKTYKIDRRIAVEISDTGKGIAPEIREKIFDPFYSTRHEGTGLGLSIVYRILREHGGDISVTSEVGKGTTFKLLF